ncbi:MAG: nitroreductase [Ktedonobacteraceae bacterium]|nr:nitroreductase [Ktedonobacteraceae bacterium]
MSESTVFKTIKRRYSIGKLTGQSPTREQIGRMLEAATHAPNHYRVEPWRFFVVAGKARNELGAIMERALAKRTEEQAGNMASGKVQALLEKERNKPLRAPVVIVVAAEHPRRPGILDIENVAATAAAVENMLLAAEEMGLACMWRTGDAAYDPLVKQWLGLEPEDHIVAFVYTGYPAIPPIERHPTPVEEKTTWLGWPE